MKNNKNAKSASLHRIKIIQGHLKAIEKMLSEDKYCIDILRQSYAVQQALKKLDQQLLDNHLNHCLVDQIKAGDQDKAVAELLDLFELK